MLNFYEIFQNKDTKEIAKELLGKKLVHQKEGQFLSGYIVDVECYLGPLDEASHSFGFKKTPRLKAMYDKPGSIYIYQMHRHFLLNLVTQEKGVPEGIMIRALEPNEGLKTMEELRQTTGVNLTNGPGKVTQALNIKQDLYGKSIFSSSLFLTKGKVPEKIIATSRIGIPNKGIWTDLPLRYYVAGNPYVTKIKKSDVKASRGWREER